MATDRELAHGLGMTVRQYARWAERLRTENLSLAPHAGAGDMTQELRDAIARTEPGGTVRLSPGRFCISDELPIKKSLVIQGSPLTSIWQTNPSKRIFVCDARGTHEPSGALGVRIEQLQLVGATTSIDWAGGVFHGHLSSVRSVEFSGPTEHCMRFSAPLLGASFSDLMLTSNGYGIYAIGGTAGAAGVVDLLGNTTWSNCNFNSSAAGKYALCIGDPDGSLQQNVLLINPTFQTCRGSVIYSANTRLTLLESHFEANGLAGNGSSVIYEDVHMGGLQGYLYLRGGNFTAAQPAQGPANARRRVKFLNGSQRLFSYDVAWGGGANNVIDRNSVGGSSWLYFSSGGFGAAPTVVNGTWNS